MEVSCYGLKTEFEHPNPIIFTGYWEVVKHIRGFPCNASSWSLYVQKDVSDIAFKIGDFPHRLIYRWSSIDWRGSSRGIGIADKLTLTQRLTAYLDGVDDKREWYKMGRNLQERSLIHEDFVLVQLTEHFQTFSDYEKSSYWILKKTNRVKLREYKRMLYSKFRQKDYLRYLYVKGTWLFRPFVIGRSTICFEEC